MKIFIILTIILIVIIIITMIRKSKKIENIILEDEEKILFKYFPKKSNTQDIKNLEELKNSLEIKQIYKKDLDVIIQKVQHDYEILCSHNMKLNKSYPDSHIYNIITNTVVSHSMHNNISIKKAIKLFLLTIMSEYIQEQLTDELSKEEELENFYKVLEKFIEKYNKYNDENKDI